MKQRKWAIGGVIILVAVALFLLMQDKTTEEMKQYTTQLEALPYISDVTISFTRPNMWVELVAEEQIGKDEIQEIMSISKSYVTVRNMQVYSDSVWSEMIHSVQMRIFTEKVPDHNGEFWLTTRYYANSYDKTIAGFNEWYIEKWTENEAYQAINIEAIE